jgi:hypothetical protein
MRGVLRKSLFYDDVIANASQRPLKSDHANLASAESHGMRFFQNQSTCVKGPPHPTPVQFEFRVRRCGGIPSSGTPSKATFGSNLLRTFR